MFQHLGWKTCAVQHVIVAGEHPKPWNCWETPSFLHLHAAFLRPSQRRQKHGSSKVGRRDPPGFLWDIRYTLKKNHGYIGAYIHLYLTTIILFYWTMNMQKWMRNSFLQVEDRFKFVFQKAAMINLCDLAPPHSMLGSTPKTFCLSFVHWRSKSNQPFIKGTLPAVFWVSCPPWIPRPQKSTKEVHCDDVELKTVEHHDDHRFS